MSIHQSNFHFATPEVLQGDNRGNYTSSFIPETGKEYVLNVRADGFPNVMSQNTIPESVSIQSFSVEIELSDINLGEAGYRAQLTFDDPAAIDNHYGIELIIVPVVTADIFSGDIGFMLIEDSDVGLSGNVDINIGDPSQVKDDTILFFDDAQFDGQSRQLEFFIITTVKLSKNAAHDVYIILKSLSPEYYDYLLTTSFQKAIEENGTFAEPVQIANNIQNGPGQTHLKIKYFLSEFGIKSCLKSPLSF